MHFIGNNFRVAIIKVAIIKVAIIKIEIIIVVIMKIAKIKRGKNLIVEIFEIKKR